MLKIETPKGAFGPFTAVEIWADRYHADGGDYPFTVIGQGEVLEWDGVPPIEVAPLPVPASVPMRQARLALLGAGVLAQVDVAIAALPSPQKEAAQIEWEYAQEVLRDSPLIAALSPSLGLDDAQVDELFRAAAGL